MTRRQNRVFVVLDLPGRVPDLIIRARAIIEACATHPRLKNPDPPLADLTALADDVEAAQTAMGLGGKDARPARDVVADRLRKALKRLGLCVEDQANLPGEDAESFIHLALMYPRARSTRRKKPISVKSSTSPGSAVVDVRAAGANVLYKWQVSVDGGKTWPVYKETKQSKTTLEGLPVGQTVLIRCEYIGIDAVPHLTDVIAYLVK